MTTRAPHGDTVVAMCAALAPYAWRRFTPELFARTALAAGDRLALERVLVTVEGAAVGPWESLEPAARDDARVARLVGFLACHHWTGLRLPALCRSIVGVLEG